MLGRITRVLGLMLLVLCTLVPADVRARMAEACRESDDCACRRAAGEHADDEQQPIARRIDCCAAPCEIDVTSTSAKVSPGRDTAVTASVTVLPDTIVAAPSATTGKAARRGGRDPPQRVHALVQHWLV